MDLPRDRPLEARIESEEVGEQNRRFGIRLNDGSRVEAVLYRGDTLCVSTQVGCAVGCPFCASGAKGLGRQLTLGEMTDTVRLVHARHPLQRLTLSGIGEPLHNHAVTTRFVEWACKQNLKASLTTSGGPLPRLRTWLETVPHNGITLSVHAGTEAVRKQLVPHGPALEPLFGLLESVLPTLTRKRRKKVALAYLMMQGVSAEDSELDAFAARAVPLGVAVHLFAYNPVRTSSQKPVSRARYEAAYERLRAQGLVVRMSSAARLEANGGCGTLVALSPPPRSAEQTS